MARAQTLKPMEIPILRSHLRFHLDTLFKISLGGGGWGARGCCLRFCFLGVLGMFIFKKIIIMVLFLCPPSMRDISCLHCSSLYILGDLLRHVKSAHPPASLIS
jgi:hypothetical protein